MFKSWAKNTACISGVTEIRSPTWNWDRNFIDVWWTNNHVKVSLSLQVTFRDPVLTDEGSIFILKSFDKPCQILSRNGRHSTCADLVKAKIHVRNAIWINTSDIRELYWVCLFLKTRQYYFQYRGSENKNGQTIHGEWGTSNDQESTRRQSIKGKIASSLGRERFVSW